MLPHAVLAAVIALAAPQAVPMVIPANAPTAPERTMTVDPVRLKGGTTVEGTRDFAVAFEGNTYLFESADTRDVFLRDPVAYAAIDAGACGRMGPLGGLGDARRHMLQDGMLYFFASDQCMQAFRAEPRLYMEPYDQLPQASPEAQAAGLAALDRWMDWAGGRDAVARADTFRSVTSERVMSGGREWDRTEALEITGPQSMRRLDVWRAVGDPAMAPIEYEIILTPDRATLRAGGVLTELQGTRRTAFARSMNRQPWAILRARLRPEAGLLAIKNGEGRLGDAMCDYVTTWFEGNLTNLAIDQATGRLVQMGYMGRDTEQRIRSLLMDAVAHAGPDALRLPTQWVTYPAGEKEGLRGPQAQLEVGWERPKVAPPSARQAPVPQAVPATR
jgi:YHS domain-containing protein